MNPPSRPLPSLCALLLLILVALAGAPALAQRAPVPPELIALDSPEGQRLLMESTAKADYFPLTEHFVTQKTQAYCGVASSVMVLNSLPIPAPVAEEWAPFHLYTQDNLFDAKVRAVVTPEKVNRGGLTLDELARFLQTQPVQAQALHAGDTSLEQFRELAVKNLGDPSNFVIINWLRAGLGQEPNGPIEGKIAGHFSPLAAYHAGSDRFLLLDVARYKYPPVWVEAKRLFDAMNTVDLDGGKTRGFVVVSPGAGVTPGTLAPRPSLLVRALGVVAGGAFLVGVAIGALLNGYRYRRRARQALSPR